MFIRFLAPATIGLTTATLIAGELAIEKKSFEVTTTLDARIMPEKPATPVRLEPKAWTDFTILSLADHGSSVKKGDVLVAFESRELDQAIEDLKSQIAARELEIANSSDAIARLEETADDRLKSLRHAADVARENHAYFTKTGRKASEEQAAQKLEIRKQWLENQKEELRQLKAMYEADDLTEDTEEIILIRQQNAVTTAEFELRMEQLGHDRKIQVLLPRRAVGLATAERDSAVALKYAEASIPREITEKKAALQTLLSTQQRAQQRLKDLEHDHALCEIKADANGTFYHGAIRDSRWVTGDLLRSLHVGGSPPADVAFASLIPASSPLVLVAHADAATARSLDGCEGGIAFLKGAQDTTFPVSIVSIAGVPDTSGNHRVVLNPTWDKSTMASAAVGNPAMIHLLVHHNPKAIVIPADATHFGSSGWTVELKLANGSTERRPVIRGLQSGKDLEILGGLEAGQVIVTP